MKFFSGLLGMYGARAQIVAPEEGIAVDLVMVPVGEGDASMARAEP